MIYLINLRLKEMNMDAMENFRRYMFRIFQQPHLSILINKLMFYTLIELLWKPFGFQCQILQFFDHGETYIMRFGYHLDSKHS